MPGKSRPNILFICTDQQRYDALGCYGNRHIQTPAIDRLARDGVLFEQCYVQNPVCGPSRASLMTGQYPHCHGLWANGVSLPPQTPVFTRALAASGYHCALVGKMHLGAAFAGRTERRVDDGFASFQWAHDPRHPSAENHYHRWLASKHPDLLAKAQAAANGDKSAAVTFDTMPTEAHYSHWVGDEAIAFLTEERVPGEPFFLWTNFYDPHHPFVAPREYLDRYDPAALPEPIRDPDNLASKPAIQRETSKAGYAGNAAGFTSYSSDEVRQIIAAYYAMISLIDDEVGRILQTLTAQGLADDTLVIFTSDHGELLGDHQNLLKGPLFYEGAVRVPLIFRWPGELPGGEQRTQLVEWLDLCPTMLGAAVLPPLAGNQGIDLLPLARGDQDARSRGWALCEYRNSGYPYDSPVDATMLRRENFKLCVYHGAPATSRPREGELYDLNTDPQELCNLWHEPTARATRIELEEFLLDVLVATENRSLAREAPW